MKKLILLLTTDLFFYFFFLPQEDCARMYYSGFSFGGFIGETKGLGEKAIEPDCQGYTLRKIMPALLISKFSFNVILFFGFFFFFGPFHKMT